MRSLIAAILEVFMDDPDSKVDELRAEIDRVRSRIRTLGDRLGRGDGSVRDELNAAIRQERDLSSTLRDLIPEHFERMTMYGPPWGNSSAPEKTAVPMPMYGLPAVRRGDASSSSSTNASRPAEQQSTLARLFRRLFPRSR
jgi:hypothetical protein